MMQLIVISVFATAAIIAAYYFGIGLLYKYRAGVSKILAFIVFFSIIGYRMYRDYQDEKIVESALTEITTEIDNAEKNMMSDKDFHEFVAKSISQKDGVSLNIVPQIDTAILKINKIYQNVLNDPDFKIMITSANDSKSHSKNSAHYRGQAVDIRIKNINHRHKNEIIAAIKEILGDRFLVLHEDKGKPNEHLHVQLKSNS